MPLRAPSPYRLLICPNAFKGTLSPAQAAQAMKAGVSAAQPDWRLILVPVADGGDGTLDAFLSSLPSKRKKSSVQGPHGHRVSAEWGLLPGRPLRAVIEMARASGLALVKGRNKIFKASTYGTGQLIQKAMDAGAREILIGVGGTATGEGGAGALDALGVKFLDKDEKRLRPIPADLTRLARVDCSGLDPRLKKTKIWILCDVKNPLLGKTGSARAFGPQKGASPLEVRKLEGILRKMAALAPRKIHNQPGAGAAGALAWGLAAFAGAQMTEGAPKILKILGFRKALKGSDGLLTGEGRLDKTSFSGKGVGAILALAGPRPVWVVAGSTSLNAGALRKRGIRAARWLGTGGVNRAFARVQAASRALFSERK